MVSMLFEAKFKYAGFKDSKLLRQVSFTNLSSMEHRIAQWYESMEFIKPTQAHKVSTSCIWLAEVTTGSSLKQNLTSYSHLESFISSQFSRVNLGLLWYKVIFFDHGSMGVQSNHHECYADHLSSTIVKGWWMANFKIKLVLLCAVISTTIFIDVEKVETLVRLSMMTSEELI